MAFYDAIDKNPIAVLDYQRDWESWLAGDTIATSTWTVPTGLTEVSESNTTTTATVWLSSGTEGQTYELINTITTASGRTEEARIRVRVTSHSPVPTGFPHITVAEAIAVQPAAEGEESFKIEMVMRQAAQMVANLAPEPIKVGGDVLSSAIDDTQTTIPVGKLEEFPDEGVVQIGSELIGYRGRSNPTSSPYSIFWGYSMSTSGAPLRGVGTLDKASRGINATIPVAHALDDAVTDVTYPLLAKDAELAVFEWLWETRGYKPSRQGVIGGESFNVDFAQVKKIVKSIMGTYYVGAARRGSVPIKGTSTTDRATDPRYYDASTYFDRGFYRG